MKLFKLYNNNLMESTQESLQLCEEYVYLKRSDALNKLSTVDVLEYAKSRNSLNGSVTKLSIYVEHGLLCIEDFLIHIQTTASYESADPFLNRFCGESFFYKHTNGIDLKFGLIMNNTKVAGMKQVMQMNYQRILKTQQQVSL